MKNQWDGSPKPEGLVQLRTLYGYTQAEAAELCRVTLRAWQWWEAGQRRMPVANWELLLIKAGIHPSYALRQSQGTSGATGQPAKAKSG